MYATACQEANQPAAYVLAVVGVPPCLSPYIGGDGLRDNGIAGSSIRHPMSRARVRLPICGLHGKRSRACTTRLGEQVYISSHCQFDWQISHSCDFDKDSNRAWVSSHRWKHWCIATTPGTHRHACAECRSMRLQEPRHSSHCDRHIYGRLQYGCNDACVRRERPLLHLFSE